MAELQKTKILLTSPSGEEMELKSFESVKIENSLSNKLSTFSISASVFDETDIAKFSVGSEVRIYSCKQSENLDDNLVYKGLIESNPKSLEMVLKSYELSGSNLLALSQYILVNEAYDDWLISDIVEDLITKYALEEFSIGYIQPVEYRISIRFKDTFLYTAIERLADALGYSFNVDLSDKFNFYQTSALTSNNIIKMGDYSKGSAKFEFDSSRLVNKLTVYGGVTLSPDITQKLKGDGLNSTYLLNYKPRASSSGGVEVYLNSVMQSVGIAGLLESGVNCIINYNEKNIKFVNIADGSEKVLTASDAVTVIYRYESSLITKLDDKASIETYGRKEDLVKFLDITDKTALMDRAKEHLRKYSTPILTGSLSSWLNNWNVGENIKVEIEIDEGYFVNEWLQLTQKTINIAPNDMRIEYKFEQKKQLVEVIKDMKERLDQLEKGDENETIQQLDILNDEVMINGLFVITTSKRGRFRIGNRLGGLI